MSFKRGEDHFKFEVGTADDEVTSGYHFNMQHLVAATIVYSREFNLLDSTNTQRIFWVDVIGFIQQQMPMHYALKHCEFLRSVRTEPGYIFYNKLVNIISLYSPYVSERQLIHSMALNYLSGRTTDTPTFESWPHGFPELGFSEIYINQQQMYLKDLEAELNGNVPSSSTLQL